MNNDARTRAVRRALVMSPTSLRAIARAADVPASTLARIKSNELGASEDVAAAVADVLERWSGDLADVASEIRRATNTNGR